MYILDTDHLSVLDRGGAAAVRLIQRLASIEPILVVVSIISYEEQTRGWLSYIAKAQTVEQQIEAYQQLKQQLTNYCTIPIFDFDERAAHEYQRLRKLYPRVGSMDLKIAAIALIHQAILLTRNSSDFEQIAGLAIENWT
jgi:tRNA(fMet)-specific endonuclease VapC